MPAARFETSIRQPSSAFVPITISVGCASKMAQKANLLPSGDQASDSSHAQGEAALARYTFVGGVDTFPVAASQTSTRDSPSDFTTESSDAETIAIRFPSRVTANSRM